MTERKDFYETLVKSMGEGDFIKTFGEIPADIYALEYDFEKDVHWNESLEYAYNIFIDEEEEEDEDYLEGYANNMPCDNTGYCTSNCSQYFKCHA